MTDTELVDALADEIAEPTAHSPSWRTRSAIRPTTAAVGRRPVSALPPARSGAASSGTNQMLPQQQPELLRVDESAPPSRPRTPDARGLSLSELQQQEDLDSEEEWERRVGIRAPMPSAYAHTEYATLDDLPPVAVVPPARTPQRPRHTASGLSTPALSRQSTQPTAAAMLPVSPLPPIRVGPDLHSLDVERCPSNAATLSPSGNVTPAVAAAAATRAHATITAPPARLNQTQLLELERRSALRPVTGIGSEQDEWLAAKLKRLQPCVEEKEEEKQQQGENSEASVQADPAPTAPVRSLSHAASAPLLPAHLHTAGAPSPAVLHYLSSLAPEPEVLTPRARYDQIGRACLQVLPEADAEASAPSAAAAAAASRSALEMQRPATSGGDIFRDRLSEGLSRQVSGCAADGGSLAPGASLQPPQPQRQQSGGSTNRTGPQSPLGTARTGSSRGGGGGGGGPSNPASPRPGAANAWNALANLAQAPSPSGGGGIGPFGKSLSLATATSTAHRAHVRTQSVAVPEEHAGARHMRALQGRTKLSSEYLGQVERAMAAASFTRSPGHAGLSPQQRGLSVLAASENARVAGSKQTRIALMSGGGGSGGAGGAALKHEYSSAALLAVEEVHGIDLGRAAAQAAAEARANARRGGSPSRAAKMHGSPTRASVAAAAAEEDAAEHVSTATNAAHRPRGQIDPQLMEAASTALAQRVLVRHTASPSPANVAGGGVAVGGAAGVATSHQYMRTHALHHHLPLELPGQAGYDSFSSSRGRAGPRGADPLATAVGLGMHLVEANGFQPDLATAPSLLDGNAPLPSSSPALYLTSPSSQPDWKPPALACGALAEEIYNTSKTLSHLISSGEGRTQWERHLSSIRPAHVAEAMRKKALAESGSAASLKAAAAAARQKQMRDIQYANELAIAQRKEQAQARQTAREEARLKRAAGVDVDPIAPSGAASPGGPSGASGPSSPLMRQQMWSRLKSSSMASLALSAGDDGLLSTRRTARPTRPTSAVVTAAPEGFSLAMAVSAVQSRPVNLSRHRPSQQSVEARLSLGSPYGPLGEGLQERTRLTVPPATREAGLLFDSSVAASSDTAGGTSEQRRLAALNQYNATLARLYVAVTPQEKRFRRLDAPKINQDDVRRVVEETLGLFNPNAKKRFH